MNLTNYTRGQQVRIQTADSGGPFQVTMAITHPGNDTGWIGVGFPYGNGTTFQWVRPNQIVKTF